MKSQIQICGAAPNLPISTPWITTAKQLGCVTSTCPSKSGDGREDSVSVRVLSMTSEVARAFVCSQLCISSSYVCRVKIGGSRSSAPAARARSKSHCCNSNVVPSMKLRWNVEMWGCRFQCSIVAVGTMIRLWSKLWVPSSDVLMAPGAQLITAWCCMCSRRSVRASCSKSVAW